MSRLINEFYGPEDTGSGGTVEPFTQASMEEFLKDDEIDTPDDSPEVLDLKPEKKEKLDSDESPEDKTDDEDTDNEDKDEEISLEDELEEDLKEPDEEDLELITPLRRKEILAKYPNLFKDLPYLEKAYYREQKYTELLPTIKDAEEAVAKAQTWDKLESDLTEGNLKDILGS